MDHDAEKHRTPIQRLYRILLKMPMFAGLSVPQALEVLRVCRRRVFGEGEEVCRYGTRSDEMYILLSGSLSVLGPEGTLLTTLSPVTTVGEMGFIAGIGRSATVVARSRADLFVIPRAGFSRLMTRFPDIGVLVLRNVVGTLARRIDSSNRAVIAFRSRSGQAPTPVPGTPAQPDAPESPGLHIGRGFVRKG